jgi:hypothetical protein
VTSPASFSQSNSVTYVDYPAVRLRVGVSLLHAYARTSCCSNAQHDQGYCHLRRGFTYLPQNIEATSKFYAPEGGHEANSILRNCTVQHLVTKATDAPDLCTIAQTHRRYIGQNILLQGRRTYSTRAQNGTQHSLLSHFFSFFLLPDPRLYIVQNTCIYTHLTVYRLCMNYRWYQTALQ